MGNVHTFTQHYRQIAGNMSGELGLESAPAADCIQTTTFANMANYDLIVGVGQVSNCSSGSAVTLQMYQATDATGGGSTVVTGATDVYTSVALGSCGALAAQVRGEDLTAGYQYVGARLTTGQADGDEFASVQLLEGRARYKQAVLPA